jgi:hypothetical protein
MGMDEKLLQQGRERGQKIRKLLEVINGQTKQFWESYNDYLKDISANSGIILGGVLAVWSTKLIAFNQILIIVGAISLALATIISFHVRRKAITKSTPYILALINISNTVNEHSAKMTEYSRGNIDDAAYKKEVADFDAKYPELRESIELKDLKQDGINTVIRMPGWFSEINIASNLFLGGIIFILLSILYPLIFNR